METLVVSPYQNEYYYNSKRKGRFGTTGFGEINCRSFQSDHTNGILPNNPLSTSANNGTNGVRTPSMTYASKDKNAKTLKGEVSKPIQISPNCPTMLFDYGVGDGKGGDIEFYYSELWAGPTYTNSPPPSSLPIPKFSLRAKRSLSLELPVVEMGIKMQPLSKSLPSSPTQSFIPSPGSFASATKDLRRILNLDE